MGTTETRFGAKGISAVIGGAAVFYCSRIMSANEKEAGNMMNNV